MRVRTQWQFRILKFHTPVIELDDRKTVLN